MNKYMAGLALTLSLLAPCVYAQSSVTVSPDIQHQTMTGWEVTGRLWQFDKANDRFNDEWENHSDVIFDKLVNELGINRFRLEALSGIENPVNYWSQFESGAIGYSALRDHFYEKINDNSNPAQTDLSKFQFHYMDYVVENMLLPIKQKVEANGEELYINLNYVDFKWTNLRGNIEHSTNPTEYAEFIVTVFKHLRDKYNLVPDALEIILEADNTLSWTGANIGRGLLEAKAQLNAEGFYPEFIAPSTALASKAVPIFNGIVSVPGAADALDTFAYHRYDSSVNHTTLQNIANAAQTWNLRTGMLEHVGADSDELLDDLLIGNVSSWQQYGIATDIESNPGGYYYKVNLSNPSSPVVYMDSRAAGLSMIFKHVRMGAKRVTATASDSSMTPVSFVNTDGSHVLTIRSNKNQTINISGLANGNYSVRHATTSGVLSQKSNINFQTGSVFSLGVQTGLTTIYAQTDGSVVAAPEPTPQPIAAPEPTPNNDRPTITSLTTSSVLAGETAVLEWESTDESIIQWYVRVGDTTVSDRYFSSGRITDKNTRSVELNGLPVDGSQITFEFSYRYSNGEWTTDTYQFTAFQASTTEQSEASPPEQPSNSQSVTSEPAVEPITTPIEKPDTVVTDSEMEAPSTAPIDTPDSVVTDSEMEAPSTPPIDTSDSLVTAPEITAPVTTPIDVADTPVTTPETPATAQSESLGNQAPIESSGLIAIPFVVSEITANTTESNPDLFEQTSGLGIPAAANPENPDNIEDNPAPATLAAGGSPLLILLFGLGYLTRRRHT